MIGQPPSLAYIFMSGDLKKCPTTASSLETSMGTLPFLADLGLTSDVSLHYCLASSVPPDPLVPLLTGPFLTPGESQD